MPTQSRVNYPKLKKYNRVLTVNSRTTMTYRWMKEDIQKCLAEVLMDIIFVGFYTTTKGLTTTVIAYNDEFVPQIVKQLISRFHWFDSVWTSTVDTDVNDFAWEHYVDYDPDVLTPIPAARSTKSKIVIKSGRLIRYDATEEEVQGISKREKVGA